MLIIEDSIIPAKPQNNPPIIAMLMNSITCRIDDHTSENKPNPAINWPIPPVETCMYIFKERSNIIVFDRRYSSPIHQIIKLSIQ